MHLEKDLSNTPIFKNLTMKIYLSFVLILISYSVHATRIDGIRILAEDKTTLTSSGISLSMERLNRNWLGENRAGNIELEISISRQLPVPISQINFQLETEVRSADTSIPISISEAGYDSDIYRVTIGACDIDRSEINIEFNFDGLTEESPYYYYVDIASFVIEAAKTNNYLSEFMDTRKNICSLLGINIDTSLPSSCTE